MKQDNTNAFVCPKKQEDGTESIKNLNADLRKIRKKQKKRKKRRKAKKKGKNNKNRKNIRSRKRRLRSKRRKKFKRRIKVVYQAVIKSVSRYLKFLQ